MNNMLTEVAAADFKAKMTVMTGQAYIGVIPQGEYKAIGIKPSKNKDQSVKCYWVIIRSTTNSKTEFAITGQQALENNLVKEQDGKVVLTTAKRIISREENQQPVIVKAETVVVVPQNTEE